MLRRFTYRLYPTPEQSSLIEKHIGSVRFVYNLALETKQAAYVKGVNLNRYDLQRQLQELKSDCTWLKEVNSQSLCVALMNLDAAYLRFFKGQCRFPNFKKKAIEGRFNVPQNVIIRDGKLIIPKFKNGINIVLHRQTKGLIRQATVIKTPAGRYFASILCDTGEAIKKPKPIKERTTVGIDLGIKTFITSSNGQTFANPKFLRQSLSKLKYIQRKYSKRKGKRTRQRLTRLHEKIASQRKDFLHKTSTQLIKSHDSIAIETINIKGLLKNHNLAQSINDAGWYTFVTMLKYKANWYGKNILQIGRFEPSSKLCSNCGNTNKELTLADRVWTCKNCNTSHDRDINAAINIKNFALKNFVSGTDTKNRNELPTLVGVLTSETPKE